MSFVRVQRFSEEERIVNPQVQAGDLITAGVMLAGAVWLWRMTRLQVRDLKEDFHRSEERLKEDFQKAEARLRQDMQRLEDRLFQIVDTVDTRVARLQDNSDLIQRFDARITHLERNLET